MIYAKAHDQTVAEDYFAAMQRVEERLETGEQKNDEVVKVQEVFQLIQRLEIPELCFEERVNIVCQLRKTLGHIHVHDPTVGLGEVISLPDFPAIYENNLKKCN